jgi:hypothetical protein
MKVHARIFRFAIVTLCIAVIGCSEAKKVFQDLGELSSLRTQLMKKFHVTDISVNLTNGRYLTVGLANSPMNGLSTFEKRMKAREIASFVAKS